MNDTDLTCLYSMRQAEAEDQENGAVFELYFWLLAEEPGALRKAGSCPPWRLLSGTGSVVGV